MRKRISKLYILDSQKPLTSTLLLKRKRKHNKVFGKKQFLTYIESFFQINYKKEFPLFLLKYLLSIINTLFITIEWLMIMVEKLIAIELKIDQLDIVYLK